MKVRGSYTEKVAEDDTVFTRDEFLEMVAEGTFSEDGTGYPAIKGWYDRSCPIDPPGSFVLPDDCTHVIWFAK